MNMQAIILRIAFVAFLGVTSVVGLVYARQNQHQVASITPTNAVAASAKPFTSAPVLPTVMLATISVRPSAAEIAEAMHEPDNRIADTNGFDPLLHFVSEHGHAPTPTLRLEMPYYSFGKALRHTAKE